MSAISGERRGLRPVASPGRPARPRRGTATRTAGSGRGGSDRVSDRRTARQPAAGRQAPHSRTNRIPLRKARRLPGRLPDRRARPDRPCRTHRSPRRHIPDALIPRVLTGKARRSLCTGPRDEGFLHSQLRARDVPDAAVPLVNAAPPPYGGQHAGPRCPHLTIGKADGRQALSAAAESVRPCLPIEATAAEVILMAGPRPGTPGTPPGQWRTVATFPLGQRLPRPGGWRRSGQFGVLALHGRPAALDERSPAGAGRPQLRLWPRGKPGPGAVPADSIRSLAGSWSRSGPASGVCDADE